MEDFRVLKPGAGTYSPFLFVLRLIMHKNPPFHQRTSFGPYLSRTLSKISLADAACFGVSFPSHSERLSKKLISFSVRRC
jgi:hypothetical protein